MVVSWTRFHLSLIECLDSPYRRSLYSSPTVAAYCTNTPSLLLLLLLLLHTGDCRQLQVEGKGGQVSQKVKASEHAPQTEGTKVALLFVFASNYPCLYLPLSVVGKTLIVGMLDARQNTKKKSRRFFHSSGSRSWQHLHNLERRGEMSTGEGRN